jgi:hypothetical protein
MVMHYFREKIQEEPTEEGSNLIMDMPHLRTFEIFRRQLTVCLGWGGWLSGSKLTQHA